MTTQVFFHMFSYLPCLNLSNHCRFQPASLSLAALMGSDIITFPGDALALRLNRLPGEAHLSSHFLTTQTRMNNAPLWH